MSEGTQAVFLSYASQDSEAARRIADALRAAGVEVWFDQSELRGGDAWDQSIRRQIKECALFVPVISANTQARGEGYFRLEWKLAVDRSHLLADDHPLLLPVAIGDLSDATARVPDKLRDVQWTWLRLDETPAELAKRVARLLAGGEEAGRGRRTSPAGTGDPARQEGRRPGWLRYGWAAVGILFGLVYALRPIWQPMRPTEPRPPVVAPPALSLSNGPALRPSNGPSEARQLVARARAITGGGSLTRAQLDAAGELCDRAIALDPTDAAAAEWRAGVSAVDERLSSAPDDRRLLLWKAWLQACLGNTSDAGHLLTRAQGLAGLAPDKPDGLSAKVFLRLGRDDAVVEYLARAFQEKKPLWETGHAEARFDPIYDRLRGNPRFVQLLRDNLPPGAKPFDAPPGT